jgi:hypothetical protein
VSNAKLIIVFSRDVSPVFTNFVIVGLPRQMTNTSYSTRWKANCPISGLILADGKKLVDA